MTQKQGKLEEGLLQAMQAIDNQVARAMQRTPAERELHGVQKWEPYSTRIEDISAFLLQEFGDGNVKIDALLVCAQAFTKALQLACDDLREEGLGKVRTSYCLDAADKISRDSQMIAATLSDQQMT